MRHSCKPYFFSNLKIHRKILHDNQYVITDAQTCFEVASGAVVDTNAFLTPSVSLEGDL